MKIININGSKILLSLVTLLLVVIVIK